MKPKSPRLTEGREGVARSLHAHGDGSSIDIGPCLGCELLAEIDALRLRPVIATCGDCTHLCAQDHCDDDGRWLYCSGGERGRMLDDDARESVPPAWCPLRGKK